MPGLAEPVSTVSVYVRLFKERNPPPTAPTAAQQLRGQVVQAAVQVLRAVCVSQMSHTEAQRRPSPPQHRTAAKAGVSAHCSGVRTFGQPP